MNRIPYAVSLSILALSGITYALAQQPTAAPRCPDYSLQLAQGLQAFSDRDNAIAQMRNLDATVTELKKELKDAEDKVTADDAIIKTMRNGAPKDEAPKESTKP